MRVEEESAGSSGNHEEVVRVSRREGKEEEEGVKGRDAPGRREGRERRGGGTRKRTS